MDSGRCPDAVDWILLYIQPYGPLLLGAAGTRVGPGPFRLLESPMDSNMITKFPTAAVIAIALGIAIVFGRMTPSGTATASGSPTSVIAEKSLPVPAGLLRGRGANAHWGFGFQSLAVDCPPHMRVTGGGYRAPLNRTNITNVLIVASFPDGTSGWRVQAANGAGRTQFVEVYAVCTP